MNAFLGVQGGYDFQNYVLEADTLPVFPKDLVGQSTLHKDALIKHTVSVQLTLYPASTTSLWCRGSFSGEHVERTYSNNSENDDFTRRQRQLHVGLDYDINQRFSVQWSYSYLRQNGDVRIKTASTPLPIATYDTHRQRHTLMLGLIGRF
jgi:hypothetical protein